MPRSFLVKRRKSDNLDFNPETEIGKERICEAGQLNLKKPPDSNEGLSSKNWYIEYHPAVPHIIPGKCCPATNHGNTRPCYICHHGNMIPSHNGCIKYTPIQVPPRYNGMCYCMVCQQRSATVACNCQSCLSLRFEQTAASVLGSSDNNILSSAGLCCGGMRCKRIEPVKYEFCQCAPCMDRMSRETGFCNNLHLMRQCNRPKVHVIQHNTKDQNNNEHQTERTITRNESNAKSSESDISNCEGNPAVELKADENHKQHDSWTLSVRKRKHEEPEGVTFTSKVIKIETPVTETQCENNSLSERNRDKEKNENFRCSPMKQLNKEETEGEYINLGQDDSAKDEKDQICVVKSGVDDSTCNENGFDLVDKKEIPADVHKKHNHPVSNARRGRRHYNTRLTTTKPRSFEKDFVVPVTSEWKQDKEMYSCEISKSRQRSKLNRLLANEHERRRVAQLNSAYQDLRQLIPGYQCDTKLPKIKILRYAINYIAHLDNILEVHTDK